MVEEVKTVSYADREFSLATKHQRGHDDWLVFLHGIGCAKECFDAVFEDELAQQYSILTFDFVGFGGSDKPDDFAYSMEDHAAMAKLLIDQFKPRSVAVVAHSMGGTIGTILAQQLDNLVSLINAEGNLVSEDAGIVSRKTGEQSEADFVEQGFGSFVTKLKEADESAYQTWAGWYEHSSPRAIYRSGISLVEWSDGGKLLPIFNNLPKKAYIYGEKTDCAYVLQQLEGVNIIPIADSGHFMMLDNPKDFYDAVRSHLAN